jgi:hypothetical protein
MHLETFHYKQKDHDPFVIIQPTPFTTIHRHHIFTEKEKKQHCLESQHYRNKITDAWFQIGQTSAAPPTLHSTTMQTTPFTTIHRQRVFT